MTSRKKPGSAPPPAVAAPPSTHNRGREALNLESAGAHAREDAVSDPALVERLAYAFWEQRGRPHGSADDWLRAEQLLREDSAR